jgi:glycerol uptake facilitator-like aquaporin
LLTQPLFVLQGHISILKGILYWVAQISGGIVGTLLTASGCINSVCIIHEELEHVVLKDTRAEGA